MKKLLTVALALLVAAPVFAAKLENVPLVDNHCGAGMKTADEADKHDRTCLVKCAKNGYALLKDGKLWKLDAKGNELAAAALAKSDKKDKVRVTVEGEVKGDMVAVESLTID